MAIMQRFKGKIAFVCDSLIAAGKALTSYKASGNIFAKIAAVGSAATNTLQTLVTYSLPANAFDVVGRGLFIMAWGTFAGNANNKSVNLNFGGIAYASGSSTQSGAVWELDARIFKSAAAAQAGIFVGKLGTTAIAPANETDTSSDTQAITISVTATSGSAAQSDIILDGMMIEYYA